MKTKRDEMSTDNIRFMENAKISQKTYENVVFTAIEEIMEQLRKLYKENNKEKRHVSSRRRRRYYNCN